MIINRFFLLRKEVVMLIRGNHFSKTWGLFIFTCLAVTLLAAGCGGGGKANVYKVGAILSLSGPAAPLGQSEQRSITLLQEKLDAAGGIDGGKVVFLIEDDESDPLKATQALNKLQSQEGAVAIIGSSTTGASLAMAPEAQKRQLPLISMAAGTKLTQPVQEWLFSVAPGDALVMRKVLLYFRDDLKVENVAVLHDSNAYGTGGAEEFKAASSRYGISVVASESYGSADTDMTPQLTKIAGTSAQAILVWGTNPGPASIAKNMQQLNIKIPFVGSSGIANKKFIELAGPGAEGVVFPASRIILPETIDDKAWSEAVTGLADEYKNKYNMEMDTFAAHGWDAANIIVDAIREAGSDPAAIRDAIEKTSKFAGADGVFTYTAKDHAGLELDALVMVRIAGGEWTPAVTK